ncbi:iron ABC transporter permease [Paenibacillus chondroitinus]|uniref:Iron ABC transporter permease n=1 Tax=Paenibacillus chondroitinus TaxID=59842 RepID=A0ABU6D410_9BACL|nr:MULTISPECIES: iron ABC transporter permease [Paenibacillus]MCY9660793.1 iron ABC transporter permease [Paenibacillus anseongense]MEB4792409.1 iron ABC transporter permease [Paenibacillus chondroitinus]
MVFKRTGTFLALLLLAMLVVLPLLFVSFKSIWVNGSLDLLAPIRVVLEKDLTGVFSHSLMLGIWVVVGCTLLALPLAWIMAKTPLRKHRWLDIVLLIPFMTPPYIGSMGWILFMQPRGYLEQFFPGAQWISSQFFSLFGMITIMSLHLFPFLYLILRNAILQIGSNKEEAAAVHGASFFYSLRRVMLPLVFSSYIMGSLLIFVKTLAEFGTPATFGRRIGYFVLTTEIQASISSWPVDFGKATSLASLLLLACLVLWYIQSVVVRRNSYNLVGGKGTRNKVSFYLGWQQAIAWLYVALLLAASIGIPYFSIISASLMKLRGGGLAWNNLTLLHYGELLKWGSPSMKALLNSLGLALLAACLAAALGTWFALTIGRAKRLPQRITDMFSLLPNTVPDMVLVVGLIMLWNAPWMPLHLYNTYGMVVLTYVVFFLPYTVQYVKARNGQLDESLRQAGQVFGGQPLYVFRRIVLPLLLPGIVAGWMMTFTISLRELVASLMVLPPSMQTSATYIFAQFEQGQISLGMAMAVVSVGLTTVLLLIVNNMNTNRKWNVE